MKHDMPIAENSMISTSEYDFWLLIRQALLLVVDAIERKLGLPRTAELRRKDKKDE